MTKQTLISMINIDEHSVIGYRTSVRAFDDDGTMIGERFLRSSLLEPGQDVSGHPVKIRAIANLLWTPQVIADYVAWKATLPKFP